MLRVRFDVDDVFGIGRFRGQPDLLSDIVNVDQGRRMGRCSELSVVKGKVMATGTVKWFNPVKGFGFIEPEDGSKDAFVHISAVERAGLTGLQEGQRVHFELQPSRDGKQSAENLTLAD